MHEGDFHLRGSQIQQDHRYDLPTHGRRNRPYDHSGVIIAVIVIALSFMAAIVLMGSIGCQRTMVESEDPQEQTEMVESSQETAYLATPERIQNPYTWSDGDLQGDSNPLPASLYILCRANNIAVDRGDVIWTIADDPTPVKATQQLDTLLPAGKVSVPISGVDLAYLPAPSAIGFSDDGETRYVVLLYSDGESMTVADPTSGMRTYATGELSEFYENGGKIAYYIADLGYTVPTER